MKSMSFEKFARYEITSGDLDPDYLFINRVCSHLKLDEAFKAKWILLKTVVYNSESELRFLFDFEKDFLKLNYGMERVKAKHRAAEYWSNATARCSYQPILMFRALPKDANRAMESIEKISGFGPWAAWKMIDLAACCLGNEFDFSKIDFRRAYDYPLRGMMLIAGEPIEDTTLLKNDLVYRNVYRRAVAALGSSRLLAAPPSYRRLINIQEMETLFCKFHSYRHGRYEPGEDAARLRKRISESKHSKIRALKGLVP